MTKRYFIYLSYNGAAYHGWQYQPNGMSVQESLEKALSTILRTEVSIMGAGRTDAGVHAKLMVAHVDLTVEIKDMQQFVYKLNSLLPADIAVSKLREVKVEAHARFDATYRTYEYCIVMQKSPFFKDWATRVSGDLDFEAMNEAAKCLFDYIDFTSFSKLHTDVKTNNCKIMRAEWEQRGEMWVFTIQADRFLRNMVRAIVGTLFEVGRGKMTKEQFRAVIETKSRSKAGTSADAHGLYLVDVGYPEEIFLLGNVEEGEEV